MRTKPSIARQTTKILAGRMRIHHQPHGGGVRCNDNVVRQAALESKARYSEGVVLVVQLSVELVVAGLGNAPWHAALPAVLHLPLNDRAIGFVEQRSAVRWHDQQGHEVLEHRAAPGEQRRPAAGIGQHPSEAEPVILWKFSLGDCDKACESRLRCEQIIKAGVAPVIADVIPNRQELAVLVV
jgi:hypothetical protein